MFAVRPDYQLDFASFTHPLVHHKKETGKINTVLLYCKGDYIGIDTTPEVEKVVTVLAPVLTEGTDNMLPLGTDIASTYAIMQQDDELFLEFLYKQPARFILRKSNCCYRGPFPNRIVLIFIEP